MATEIESVEILTSTSPSVLGIPAADWTSILARVTALEGFDSFTKIAAQDDADNLSTTSTTNYTAAMDFTFTLPTGANWTIKAIGGVSLSHSASGTVNARIQIAGNIGSNTSRSALSTSGGLLVAVHNVTGVSAGIKTIRLEYKCGTAGTTSGDNPWLVIVCEQLATP